MGLKLWIGIVLLLSVSATIAEEDGVWVLTDNNFEEALNLQPDLLVEFYAPWCGHCKKLAPEYSKAAKRLAQNSPPIRIAKVDATANSKLASSYKLEGYPTLKYFVNKEANEYTGGRTEDTIVSWVLKRNTPSLSKFTSLSSLQSFSSSHKVLAVLFSDADSDSASTFESVSKSIDSVTFALISDPEALTHYSVDKNSIVLLKHFDDKRVDYKGRLTQLEITKFINDNRLPWVLPFGDDAIDAIFKKQSPALFFFTENYESFQTFAEELSQEFKGVLVFSYADLNIPDNSRLAEYLGVKASQQPKIVIVDTRGELKKYKMDNQISHRTVQEFIGEWRNRKLESFLKSDPAPADPYDGNVRVLVGENFESVVFDQTKDVLVEFYAPWCGHCKSLAPEYEKLAAEYKSNTNLVIAKMDSTTNEAKGVAIKGFPTLKFYPAGNKKPIDFEGERNFEGLSKFIKEKSTAGTNSSPEPKKEPTIGKEEL
jgi:protein disulfide-isomerase A1